MIEWLHGYDGEIRTITLIIALLGNILFWRVRSFIPGVKGVAEGWQAHLRAIERKLNRPQRSVANRIYRGIIAALYVMLLSGGVGYALTYVSLQHPLGVYGYMFVTYLLLPAGYGAEVSQQIRTTFKDTRPHKLQIIVKSFTGLHTDKAEIPSLLRWQCDFITCYYVAIISASMAFLVAGLVGLCMVWAIITTARLWERCDTEKTIFSWAITNLRTMLTFIPSLMAALFTVLGALFIPKASCKKTLRPFTRALCHPFDEPHRASHKTLSAALTITLGGPQPVAENANLQYPWIGNGSARISAQDFIKAHWILRFSMLITVMALGWGYVLVSTFL